MDGTAEEVLKEVRDLGARQREPLRISNTHEYYGLIHSCLNSESIPRTRFTKILVSIFEAFDVEIENDYTPFLPRIYLYGPEPEGNTELLNRHKWLISNPSEDMTKTKPVAVQDPEALAEVRERYDESILSDLSTAVEFLQTLTTENLIEISYSLALGRETREGENIGAAEVDNPVVVFSLARNLREFERTILKSRAEDQMPFSWSQGEKGITEFSIRRKNGLTCLKDGTDNALLCLAGLAVLRSRGHKTGKRLQNLLATLSCYYCRARVRASKLMASLRRNGPSYTKIKDGNVRTSPKQERMVEKIEELKEDAEQLERETAPHLEDLITFLSEKELVAESEEGLNPVSPVVGLNAPGRKDRIDLREIIENANEYIGTLDKLANSPNPNDPQGVHNFDGTPEPDPPVFEEEESEPQASDESDVEWF